jgi:hypothetical protein
MLRGWGCWARKRWRSRAAGDMEGSALAWQLRAFDSLLEGQYDRAAEHANQAVATLPWAVFSSAWARSPSSPVW